MEVSAFQLVEVGEILSDSDFTQFMFHFLDILWLAKYQLNIFFKSLEAFKICNR